MLTELQSLRDALSDRNCLLLGELDGLIRTEESLDGQAVVTRDQWLAVVDENAHLRGELEHARMVLVFADGVAVSNSGFALADLYGEDYRPAQDALKAAGCHPRGRFRDPTKGPST